MDCGRRQGSVRRLPMCSTEMSAGAGVAQPGPRLSTRTLGKRKTGTRLDWPCRASVRAHTRPRPLLPPLSGTRACLRNTPDLLPLIRLLAPWKRYRLIQKHPPHPSQPLLLSPKPRPRRSYRSFHPLGRCLFLGLFQPLFRSTLSSQSVLISAPFIGPHRYPLPLPSLSSFSVRSLPHPQELP